MSTLSIGLLIIGLTVFIVGCIMLCLSGCAESKYEKNNLRKFIGWNVVVLGLATMLLAIVIQEIPNEYTLLLIILWMVAYIGVIVKMIYRAKINRNMKIDV